MALVVGIVVAWLLIVWPLGIIVQRLALGEVARTSAIVIAPVTGLATAVILLGLFEGLGLPLGTTVAVGIAALITVIIMIWRRSWEWFSPRLAWGLVAIFLLTLVLMAPIESEGRGPLGYATGNEPVAQVVAADKLLEGEPAGIAYPGYELLLAMTGWLGGDEWAPFGMHAVVATTIISFVVLPLLLFSWWRGIGRLGSFVLVLVGAAASLTYVELAAAQGSAVLGVPFATALVVALLLGRRDRGWYTLSTIFAGALAVTAGPAALAAPAVVFSAWVLLARGTREHMPAAEKPAPGHTAVVIAALTAMFTFFVIAPGIAAGDGLQWRALSGDIGEAVRTWPFAWVGADLQLEVPSQPLSLLIWLVGPALLGITLYYGIVRRERRELAVVIGTLVVVALGAAWSLASEITGVLLIESSLLLMGPMLAAVIIRAAGLSRAAATESRKAALAGAIPAALIATFAVLVVASTVTAGSRVIQAPGIAANELLDDSDLSTVLLTSTNPWVSYGLGEAADAVPSINNLDALAATPGSRTASMRLDADSLVYGNYAGIIVPSNPFASNPPRRYDVTSAYSQFGVVAWLDTYAELSDAIEPEFDGAGDEVGADVAGDSADGADDAEAADEQAVDEADASAEGDAAVRSEAGGVLTDEEIAAAIAAGNEQLDEPARIDERPLAHVPVEADAASPIGGIIMPPLDNGEAGDTGRAVECPDDRPDSLGLGVGIARDGLEEQFGDDASAAADEAATGGVTELGEATAVAADANADGDIGGTGEVQQPAGRDLAEVCWKVPVPDSAAKSLVLHIRTLGIVMQLKEGQLDGDWDAVNVGGRTMFQTTDPDAIARYDSPGLFGNFAMIFEGEFSAGASVTTGQLAGLGGGDGPKLLATYGDWSDGLGGVTADGLVEVANTSGTLLRLGWLAARPADMPPEIELVVAPADGDRATFPSNTLAPQIAVEVVDVQRTKRGARIATLRVRSNAGFSGTSYRILLDWVEQYASPPIKIDPNGRAENAAADAVREGALDQLADGANGAIDGTTGTADGTIR